MNPYHDLRKSSEKYVNDRIDYGEKAASAVASALVGLRKYLDVPAGATYCAPPAKERQEGAQYCPLSAVSYDDGWWSGCLLVDVSGAGGGSGREATINFTISAFVDANEVIFRVGDSVQAPW
jgi:hypothetical protein